MKIEIISKNNTKPRNIPEHGDIVVSKYDTGEDLKYLFVELPMEKAVVLSLQDGLELNSSIIDRKILKDSYKVHTPKDKYDIKILLP